MKLKYYYSLFGYLFLVLTNMVEAQQMTSVNELEKFYKKHKHTLPNPSEGWQEVWIIMPKEKDFINEHQTELVNARVYVEDGVISKVYYDNDKYVENVYGIDKVKNGSASFQKVYLDLNYNVTEVFTAFTHKVIFKDHQADVQSPIEQDSYHGNVVFFSNEKKVDKHGYYVFVKDLDNDDYDFLGYLNKKCKDEADCESLESLRIPLRRGNYEVFTVQNKIQFDRRMPMKKHDLIVAENQCQMIKLEANN
ncbi:hypothetical protein [Flammeovirga agarivorans]|uniref:Uncharacterized protein n=1 Tax=Flammeovirga agarivorans TaxID=2726742 RepID=A0A7X8SLP5_9BACT|nr:hypothetical protein [Flammeovirga agarivorans]NLR92531.1 hypothetical protein [Flammeovirga agarivorans]